MKKLASALAATAVLLGGSLATTSGAEARPYRSYAKPGYSGAYAFPRYGYYRGWLLMGCGVLGRDRNQG